MLDQHRPALLLLCHGANDLWRWWPAAMTESNLRAMVQAARAGSCRRAEAVRHNLIVVDVEPAVSNVRAFLASK